MSDIKDILGMARATPGEKAEKPKKEKKKRPTGLSREAFALLGDSHPIMSSQLLEGLKKKDTVMAKPKPSTKGIPTWQYKGFKNSARTDGLELTRWVKSYKDLNGRVREPEDADYYFAKFNKKAQLFRYTAEEYEQLIRPESGDWTKEETDQLMELCARFDLRFTVVADRFETQALPRSVEDLKDRYYAIARRLLSSREGGDSAVANHTLMRYPYNREHEAQRKRAVEMMLARTPEQAEEENAILTEFKVIEERRRSEAAVAARRNAAAAAAATAAAAAAAAAAVPAAVAMGAGADAAGLAASGYATPGGMLSPAGDFSASDLRHPEHFDNNPGPGVPSLFDQNVNPSKPPNPGVWFRSACTLATSNLMAATIATAPRTQKAVEQTLAELGFLPTHSPRVNTRAVCGAWLALRSEVLAFHDSRRAGGGSASRSLASLDDKKKAKRR